MLHKFIYDGIKVNNRERCQVGGDLHDHWWCFVKVESN